MTTPISTLTFRSPSSPNPVVAYAAKALYMQGDNGQGVQFYGDGDHPASWVKNAAPISGDILYDCSTKVANATWSLTQAVTYSNSGFDFSACTLGSNFLIGPSSPAASIWNNNAGQGSGAAGTAVVSSAGAVTGVTMTAAGSGYTGTVPVTFYDVKGGTLARGVAVLSGGTISGVTMLSGGQNYTSSSPPLVFFGPQFFLIKIALRLPAAGDWNPSTLALPFIEFGGTATSQGSYITGPDLAYISQSTSNGGSKQISFARPLSTSVRELTTIVVNPADCGLVAQLVMWRDGSGLNGLLHTVNGITRAATITGGADNPNNFSSNAPRVGVYSPYFSISSAGTAYKWKLFNVAIENLAVSGRDPLTVLAAAWTASSRKPYA